MNKCLVVLIAFLAATAVTGLQKVPVTVYYEALCPDSQKFYTKQLAPTFRDLMSSIDLHLIPFGKSKSDQIDGKPISWSCHHGPNECYANKIQSCVIDEKGPMLQPLKDKVDLIDCLMTTVPDVNRQYPIKRCASKYAFDGMIIERCANETEGDTKLLNNEKLTKNLSPPLSFVPTVVFKNQYNKEDNDDAQTNFRGILCKYIEVPKPKGCEGTSGALSATASRMTVFVTVVAFILAQ